MVAASDLKSGEGNLVRVRVPPSALGCLAASGCGLDG